MSNEEKKKKLKERMQKIANSKEISSVSDNFKKKISDMKKSAPKDTRTKREKFLDDMKKLRNQNVKIEKSEVFKEGSKPLKIKRLQTDKPEVTKVKGTTQYIKDKEIVPQKDISKYRKQKANLNKIKQMEIEHKKKTNIVQDISKPTKESNTRSAKKKVRTNLNLQETLRKTKKDAMKRKDFKKVSQIEEIIEKASKSGKKFLKKAGKRTLKSIPFLGTALGVAEAIYSKDASAAIPEEFRSTEAGPKKGTPQHRLESGEELSKEDIKKLYKNNNNKTAKKIAKKMK